MVNLILDNISLPEQELLAKNLLAAIPQDISKEEALVEWEKRAALAVVYTRTSFAYNLLVSLRQLLSRAAVEVKAKYNGVLAWLYYAAFLNLSKDEVVDFFRTADLNLILSDPNYGDLISKIKGRLLLEPLNERDQWRERVFNAVHENETVIAKDKIANWLKFYDSTVGVDVAESIVVAEFNNQATRSNNLNAIEQEILKKFLTFYEYVKLSSYDPAGFEEEILAVEGDKAYLLSNGEQMDLEQVMNEYSVRPRTLARPARPVFMSPAVVQVSAPLPALPEIIRASQAQLTATNGDAPKVILELQKNLNSANVLGAAGALLLLAQLRRLDDVLSDVPSFRALVAQDLEKSGQAVQKEGLNAQPNAPQFLARFLKIVLQDNLQINPSDALAFGQRLGELMALEGDSYRNLVIINDKGEMRWNM